MGIQLKSESDIAIMVEGGKKLGRVRDELVQAIKPGLDVGQLEQLARQRIREIGGEPNFCLTKNYPYSICVSLNDEIVHGMPKDKVIKDGDVVGIDVGMLYQGWHLDTAVTVGVGKISASDQKLLKVTKRALELALAQVKPGIKLGVISHLIQKYVESNGFCVLRKYTGHGIGRDLHEEPKIPNFGSPDEGPVLETGMVLAIEPMVAKGDCEVVVADDGWTAKMKNGSKGAHFEHTVAITKTGCRVLTA